MKTDYFTYRKQHSINSAPGENHLYTKLPWANCL